MYDLAKQAQKDIDDYMKIPIDGYTYLDFEFMPIKPKKEKNFYQTINKRLLKNHCF